MTTWDAVGGDPSPGDPAMIRQTAADFRSVDDRVQAVADRLRALASGLGRHVWTGPAADAFAAVVVTGLEAVAGDMAAKHGAAAMAMTDFANALDHVQGEARQAATAAASAVEDRNAAAQAMKAATTDAAAAVAARNQAKDRIAQAHALEASAAADPAYLAQLKQYEQEMLRLFSAALSREEGAIHRQAAARSAVEQAQGDIALAQARAEAIGREHGDARKVVVARLHVDASHAASLLHGVENGVKVAGLPDTLAKLMRAGYRRNPYSKWDHHVFDLANKLRGPGSENFFHHKRSSVLNALGKAKWIGKLADNPLMKRIGFLGYGIDLFHEGSSMRDHLRNGDYVGALADGKDLTASTLKTFGGPVGYLAGYGISVWSDVFTEARKVDWSQPVSAHDWVEYGPGAFRDALGDVGKRMIFKWS